MNDNLKAVFWAILVKWIATAEIFKELRPMTEPLANTILALLIFERSIHLLELLGISPPRFLRKRTREEPKETAKEGDKRYNPETGDLYIFDGEYWRQW